MIDEGWFLYGFVWTEALETGSYHLKEQENTLVVTANQAPFGKKDEFDEVDCQKLPVDSHVACFSG